MASPIIDYRGQFGFHMPPSEVWEAIGHTDRFEGWWPWLHDLHVDGDAVHPLVRGSVLHGVVEPPLPYHLHVDVELTRCEAPTDIEALVHGDLEGPARVHLHEAADGTTAEVSWHLEMMQRPMRLASRFAWPLLQWGHDCVVEMTVAGFRRKVEASRQP